MNEAIRLKLSMLPDTPGCYLMKGEGSILYVGKAVNLSSRVHSYFRDQAQSPKVAALMTHVDDFDIMLCGSNLEALILECNLIKLHKPYYNILLKDDKHYPYIRINTAEPFPATSPALATTPLFRALSAPPLSGGRWSCCMCVSCAPAGCPCPDAGILPRL